MELLFDALQYCIEVFVNFLISDSEDAIVSFLQILFALLIVFLLFIVDFSVYFDHEFWWHTEEVDDKTLDNDLSPEFHVFKSSVTQCVP